ncbi:endonuclease 8-like 2 [Protopterus annectens]|uniref:endonuclease 8-like 2 n=1 Tax=Protopterus annectens TaxID=7888 RepID=UPI001CFA64FD|nr:endonuclease 8-like 2 [Protopterus annectens]
MPEGPSVKKFYTLASRSVGKKILYVEGTTKQINKDELKGLILCDCKVHGKNLFLGFSSVPPSEAFSLQRHAGDMEEGTSSQFSQIMTSQKSAHASSETSEQESGSSNTDGVKCLSNITEADSTVTLVSGEAQKWLCFHFWMYGSVRANELARASQANKKGDWKDPIPRLILRFDSSNFLVFYNCRMRWTASPYSEPTSDILREEFSHKQALEALQRPQPVCYTLMNQRHFSGLGNIIKNEALYMAGVNPMTLGSTLSTEKLHTVLQHALQFSAGWLEKKLDKGKLSYKIYMKEKCPLGHDLQKGSLGPPKGLKRPSWWCPECQPLIPVPEEVLQ